LSDSEVSDEPGSDEPGFDVLGSDVLGSGVLGSDVLGSDEMVIDELECAGTYSGGASEFDERESGDTIYCVSVPVVPGDEDVPEC
jgi:hypothetical protein